MTVLFSKRFQREYRKLPQGIQKKVDRQLRRMAVSINHPGLKAHKMEGGSGIWEARIDLQYRLTFQLEGDSLLLRRVGTHEIYERP